MEPYDYSKLLGRMKEMGFTQAALARRVGISETSMNLSLNNKRDFGQDEMIRACTALEIPIGQIGDYFFAHKL